MQISARWLFSGIALLLAFGAGVYALSRGSGSEANSSRAEGSYDWQEMLAGVSDEGFKTLAGPWRLELPDDHGAHPDARAETWNIAVHLDSQSGEHVHSQFALVRVRLVPPDAPPRESPWETRAIYGGHVTILAGRQGAAVGEERLHRDVAGIAGHDTERREVRLDNWSIRYGEGADGKELRLDVMAAGVEMEFSLAPAKPPVAFNTDGDGAPFRGYSITRMNVEGVMVARGGREPVSGLAWFDHLWGDVPLPVGPIVWDRLQLQLDDGSDLSVTRSRRRDGGGTATLAGLVIDPQGHVRQIDSAALGMEATRMWSSDVAGAPYPLEWQLTAGDLSLKVAPVVDDQAHDFMMPLWSGAVTAEGHRHGEPISGRGTMLLTGSEN